jgi:nucleotide-binding universal stress UspA family protein
MRILLAVDGSKNSLSSVQCLIDHADWYRSKPEVELLTVHLPVPKVGGTVSKAQLEKYYQEEGEQQLAAAKRKLESARIPHATAVLVGPVAETIVAHAKAKGCDLIYIGTRGHTGVKSAVLGSTAQKVMSLSDLPVLLVK